MNRRIATVLFAASWLPAQSPCAPPTHLATQEPFWSTHYYTAPGQNNGGSAPIPQNLPATYRGFLTVANLTANAPLLVSQIDFKLRDDGSVRFNWGPRPGIAGPPGLLGQTAAVSVYMTATTWVGKVVGPPGANGWQLVATGTLTVMPHNQHSPAVLTAPFVIPVGTNGFAIEVGPVTSPVPSILYMPPPYALHPSLLVSGSAPGAPLTASDQFLSITDENIGNQAWVVAPDPVVKSAIFDLHYTPQTPNTAFSTPGAAGCYDRPTSFYEFFDGTAVDLGNTALAMVPTGPSYAVTAIAPTIVLPTTARLLNANGAPLGDDQRTAPQHLGFTFPFPGGSTTQVVITSNGNIFLDPAGSGSQTGTFEIFGTSGFLRGQAQFAPLWSDLDPSSGGGVFLDLVPGPVPSAIVTWHDVPTFGRWGSRNMIQVEMFANGRVEYRYGALAVKIPAIVGFSPGFNPHDPGNRDLSATLPFTTGDGAVPPTLRLDARPVLGTTPAFVLGDVPSGSAGGLLLGGAGPAVGLGALGMPGCVQHLAPVTFVFFLTSGSGAAVAMPITNAPALVGMQLTGQAIVQSVGSNAAGLLVSNPLCLHLGW